jgi:hypothetical protein
MRKISILIICIMLAAFAGCATVPEGQEPAIDQIAAQNALIEITARNLAFAVGRNNPKILDPGIAFCAAFSGAQTVDLQPLLAQGLKYLDIEVEDYPMLGQDLETLLSLFNIQILNDENIPLTARQIEMVKIAAAAMKQGFEYAKANPK